MEPRQLAVLIGVGTYHPDEKGLPSLRCPPQDVLGMEEILSSEIHGPYEVTSLVDARHEEANETLYDVLVNQAGQEDLVLLYYSGHGKPDSEGDLFLATRDTRVSKLPVTSIAVGNIAEWMRKSKARKIVLILDCCYSGAAGRMFTRGSVSDQLKQALPKQLHGMGTYVLTASTDVEMAEEKEADQYGLLTKYIIQGIRDGEADLDDDGQVSMDDLLAYVQEKVSGSQTPQGWALHVEGGRLAIARTGKANSARRLRDVVRALYGLAAQQPVLGKVVRNAIDVLENQPGGPGEERRRHDEILGRLYQAREDPEMLLTEVLGLSSTVTSERQLREKERAAEEEKLWQAELARQKAERERAAERRAAEEEKLWQARLAEQMAERARAEAARAATPQVLPPGRPKPAPAAAVRKPKSPWTMAACFVFCGLCLIGSLGNLATHQASSDVGSFCTFLSVTIVYAVLFVKRWKAQRLFRKTGR